MRKLILSILVVLALILPSVSKADTLYGNLGAGRQFSYRNSGYDWGVYPKGVCGIMMFDNLTGNYGCLTTGATVGFNPLLNSGCNSANPYAFNSSFPVDNPPASSSVCKPYPTSLDFDPCVAGGVYEQLPVYPVANGCFPNSAPPSDAAVILPIEPESLIHNNISQWVQVPQGESNPCNFFAYGAVNASVQMYSDVVAGMNFGTENNSYANSMVYQGPALLSFTSNSCTFRGSSGMSSNINAQHVSSFTLPGNVLDWSTSCGSFWRANSINLQNGVVVNWYGPLYGNDRGTGVFMPYTFGGLVEDYFIGEQNATSTTNANQMLMADANAMADNLNAPSTNWTWNYTTNTGSSGVTHNWRMFGGNNECNTPPYGGFSGVKSAKTYEASLNDTLAVDHNAAVAEGRKVPFTKLVNLKYRDNKEFQGIDSDVIDTSTVPPTHNIGIYGRCGGTTNVNPKFAAQIRDFAAKYTDAPVKFVAAPLFSANNTKLSYCK